MAIIKYNSSKVNQSATKIDEDINKLRELISRTDGILEEIKNSWTGSAATSYYNKVLEKRNALVKIADVLATLPDNLRNIATVMESTEGNIANK